MQRPPLTALAGFSALLFVVAFLMGHEFGRFPLILAAIGGIGVVALLDFGMRQLAPDLLLPRLISIAYGFQFPWVIVAAIMGSTDDPFFALGHFDLADAPLAAILPNLVVPLSAYCATFVVACVSRPVVRGKNFWQQSEKAPAGIEAYFLVGAVLHVAYWAAVSESSGVVGYFIRVGHTSLMVMPFFVGRYSGELKKARYAWLIAMSIVFVFGMLSGERFDALVPPTWFMAGYLLTVPRYKRRSALLISGALAAVLLAVCGLLGAVRSLIGRGANDRAAFISVDRGKQTVDTMMYVLTTPGAGQQSMKSEAVGRMISWPNYAAARFSPDPVPYKGWGDFGQHIKLMLFDISLFTGSTLQDRLDLGVSTAGARAYGYYVTENNSFDFGLLGDGWLRAGVWGVFIFGFALAAWMALLERSLPLFSRFAPSAPIILAMVWGAIALYVCSIPFLNEIRASILSAALLLAVIFSVEMSRSAFARRGRDRSWVPMTRG